MCLSILIFNSIFIYSNNSNNQNVLKICYALVLNIYMYSVYVILSLSMSIYIGVL